MQHELHPRLSNRLHRPDGASWYQSVLAWGEEMTRDQIERYERESVLRAMGQHRGPGDGTAQQIIRNSERRKAKRKQKAGETV